MSEWVELRIDFASNGQQFTSASGFLRLGSSARCWAFLEFSERGVRYEKFNDSDLALHRGHDGH